MSPAETVQGARQTARVLREAIEATGGPACPSLAAVRVHVNSRHTGFPWADDWAGQIEGAKAALRSRLRLSVPLTDNRRQDAAPAHPGLEAGDLDLARRLVEHTSGSDVAGVCRLLDIVDDLGGINRAREVLAVWGELLAAVDGHAGRAARALRVITQHLTPAAFPRLAPDTVESDAA